MYCVSLCIACSTPPHLCVHLMDLLSFQLFSVRPTVLVPALLACRRVFYGRDPPVQGDWMLLGSFIQPALLLIDHGHFQYNTISLGLAVSILIHTYIPPSFCFEVSVLCMYCLYFACIVPYCHDLVVGDICVGPVQMALTVISCRLELLPLLPMEGMCWAASSFHFQ
jgi:hypothetical protein